VRPLLLLAAALLLAGHAPGAHADTMYKCVDAKGKIAYSNLPCPGLAKAAREFEVAAPESAEDSAARLGAERARLPACARKKRRSNYATPAATPPSTTGCGKAKSPAAGRSRPT
jgi:hypothetical protein